MDAKPFEPLPPKLIPLEQILLMLTPFVPLLFQPLALESLLFDVTPLEPLPLKLMPLNQLPFLPLALESLPFKAKPLEPLPLKLMPLEPLPVDLRSQHLQCAAAILDRGSEWWPRLGSVATGI